MKLKLLPLRLAAACSSGPTKEESVQVFAAATTALASGQAHAVNAARDTTVAPSDLVLDFTGSCTLGGTIEIDGSYQGERSDDRAAFDLHTKFTGCRELQGTLDGELQWTSVATDSRFTATLKGGLDWHDHNSSAFCDFDLVLDVSQAGVSYGGHLCGYDVKTEIRLDGLRG